MSALGRLRKILEADIVWKKFKRQMKAVEDPELDSRLEELKMLHASRKTRTLNSGFPTGRKVAEAAAQEMAVRGRCVEIVMQETIASNHMAVAIDTIKKYIGAKHYVTMQELGIKGVNDRKELVSALLNPYNRMHDRVNTVIEIADLVIKDCDQGSFSLRHLTDALEVAVKRENV